jgi:hypothetical protein
MSNDPLLQPYKLKHLTLRNRIMTTSHEPAYPEDGMPKDRYRLYHLERAKAGVAMVMTAGSAAVSKDSPPVFNNVLAYKDEVVPWMKRIADDCHEAGAAVMIQLTHLGRRTRWDKGDWLPVLAAGPAREPSHRAFPKVMEDWDITRVINDFADAAERMKEAGLDGGEFECYGHLLDQFWSPATNTLDAPYGGVLENRVRFTLEVLAAIRPEKDVDGFHAANVGALMQGDPRFIPCTPYGVMKLLAETGVDLNGKEAVVIGRSNIVGTPLSIMLTRNTNPGNCTVTLTHSHTQNLRDICLTADILIAALGQPEFVTADMIKPGAVVIDVGTSRIEDATKKSGWRLAGDVKFDEVAPKCAYISPVPGGVGPMTIASLMINTLKAMDLKGK